MDPVRPFVVWKPTFATGIHSVDHEHQRFLEIMNELHTAVVNRTTHRQAGETLEKLLDYGSWHFQQEEELMAATGFPRSAEHQAEHAGFLKRLEVLRAEGSCSLGMLSFMSGWVVQHILGADQELGYWNAGLAPQRSTVG